MPEDIIVVAKGIGSFIVVLVMRLAINMNPSHISSLLSHYSFGCCGCPTAHRWKWTGKRISHFHL